MRFLTTLPLLFLAILIQSRPLLQIPADIHQKMLADPEKGLLLQEADAALKARALREEKIMPLNGCLIGSNATVKCYTTGGVLSNWMQHLGWAYLLTNNRTYAAKGIELLTGMAALFPKEQNFMGTPGTMLRSRGDMLFGLALGYGFFRDYMTQEQQNDVAFCAQEYVEDFLRKAEKPEVWWHDVHNLNGVYGGAAGLATLAFEDYPAIEKQQDRVNKILNRYFSTGFDPEGACYDGTGCAACGLENVLFYAFLLKQRGGPDLFKHPMFAKYPRFLASEILPGENVMDARNGASYLRPDLDCLFLAACNQDSLAAWLWKISGQSGFPLKHLLPALPPSTAPKELLPLDIRFPKRGLSIWRTGWETNDVMFSTEVGEYLPTAHTQADKGHFTLYAYGRRFAIDPGCNDGFFAGSRGDTSSHNCILIDGKGQALNSHENGPSGEIRSSFNDDLTGYALADTTKAYQKTSREDEDGVDAKKALRHNLFVKPYDGAPAYAAIFDDIEMSDSLLHDFTWQMLTWPDMTFVPRKNGALLHLLERECGRDCIVIPKDAADGTAEWSFMVPETADWQIVLDVMGMGENPSSGDAIYIQLDGQPRFACRLPTANDSQGCFPLRRHWEEKPAVFHLASGMHRIRVSTRRHDAVLRAVLLFSRKDLPWRKKALHQMAEIRLKPEEAILSGGMTRRPFETGPDARMLIHLSSEEHLKPATVDLYVPAANRPSEAYERLRMTVQGYNPRFVALLIPLPEDFPEPVITEIWKDFRLTLQIQWPTHTDILSWNGMTKPTIKHE